MFQQVKVEYYFKNDLDEQPDTFISIIVKYLADNCRKLRGFMFQMMDEEPEKVAVAEVSL